MHRTHLDDGLASPPGFAAPGGDSAVRVGPMVNITPLLEELGADSRRVFGQVGLRPEAYSDPDRRVTYLRSGRLFAECVSATGCDHFGLLVGQRGGSSHLGLAGFMVRAAPTVGDALSALVEYLDLHDEGGSPELLSENDFCRLSFHVHQPGVAAIDQIYDLCAAMLCNIMRALCGQDWVATEVCLPRSRPDDVLPYRRFFRTAIVFDAEVCGVSFACHWLNKQTPTADSLLFRHLEREAKARHQAQYREVTDMLPAVMQRCLLMNRFSAREIAQELGLRERTFHRRLQDAGTTFRLELDRVRKAVSMQLLEGTSLPVCDIAQSLGYADSSSFIRAFHRWSEESPTGWRRRHRPDHPKRRDGHSASIQPGLFSTSG